MYTTPYSFSSHLPNLPLLTSKNSSGGVKNLVPYNHYPFNCFLLPSRADSSQTPFPVHQANNYFITTLFQLLPYGEKKTPKTTTTKPPNKQTNTKTKKNKNTTKINHNLWQISSQEIHLKRGTGRLMSDLCGSMTIPVFRLFTSYR